MNSSAESPSEPADQSEQVADQPVTHDSPYWVSSRNIVVGILLVWAFVSLGCSILLRSLLDSILPKIGGAPFGFWMAQQGAVIGFLVLLVVYMMLMNRLDARHGYDKGSDE